MAKTDYVLIETACYVTNSGDSLQPESGTSVLARARGGTEFNRSETTTPECSVYCDRRPE